MASCNASSKIVSTDQHLRRRFVLARAAEKDDFDDDDASSKLAPSTPTSAHGEMLEYILSTEPDSFEGAMESVLEKLSDEIDATKALEENNNNNNNPKAKKDTTNTKDDAMSLTLYKRIEDIKKIDRRRAVEDAMYASIIHKVIIISFFFFFFGNARYSSRADNAT